MGNGFHSLSAKAKAAAQGRAGAKRVGHGVAILAGRHCSALAEEKEKQRHGAKAQVTAEERLALALKKKAKAAREKVTPGATTKLLAALTCFGFG